MSAHPDGSAAFDLWWAGGTPDEDCPSCNGSGWATVFAGKVAVAGGRCRCRGGTVWSLAAPATPKAGETP